MEWLQMSPFHISLLLLAGYLVTATNAGAGDNQTASTPEQEVPWVACATLECDKPCPTLPPSCPSGIIKKCGCCNVCWKYLNEGQLCRKFLQGNTLCGPGLVCSSSGICEHLPNVSSSEEESPE